MRKKLLSLLLCLSVVATMVGCGASEEAAATEETVTAEATATPTPEPTQEPEPETVFADAQILEIDNDDFNNATDVNLWNSSVVSYKDADGNWGVLKTDGTVLIEATEATLDGYRCEDSTAFFLRESDMSLFGYDDEGNEIVNTYLTEGTSFMGYSDGLVTLCGDGPYYEYCAINENKDLDCLVTLNYDNLPGLAGASIMQDKVIRVTSNSAFEIVSGKPGLVSYVSVSDDYSSASPSYSFTDDECIVYPYNSTSNCINENGWIGAAKLSADDFSTLANGFFNINTNQYVEAPYDAFYWIIASKSYGEWYIVADHYVALAQADENGENTELYKLFDLNIGDFISDEYADISMSDILLGQKYILVETTDEKWGYCDENMNLVSDLWDDATNFFNGYALVNIDGMEYVINEDFEIVSQEGFEAGIANSISNYDDLSKVGKAVFKIRTEDEEGNVLSAKILVVNDPSESM